jgi:hypothetical protein
VKGGRHRPRERPSRRPAALAKRVASIFALTAPAMLAIMAHHPIAAQNNPRPVITIAGTIAAEPASQVPLPIKVGPPEALPRNSFMRVRGLPPTAALSEGHAIGPGSWAVPLSALPTLKMTLPAGLGGRSDITITVVNVDGTVLVDAKTTLVVASPAASSATGPPPTSASMLRAGVEVPSPPSVGKAGVAAPGPASMTPEDRERATRLLKKGDEQMAEGNIASARLFYERAAERGLAQAAMALAATFDAAELARHKVRGLQADAVQAKRWYERARELGASDADQRLKRLGAK